MESLVAIAIVSIVFLGVVGGFLTTSAASTSGRDRARAGAALDAVAEQTSRVAYRPCATAAQLRVDLADVLSTDGTDVQLVAVEYLDATGGFAAACGAKDRGAQRVSLAVRSPDGTRVLARGQTVLRNPAARP